MGIGCAAHIMHNAIQTDADCLPVDVESVIMEMYHYSYIYNVRAQSFKKFCEFAPVGYQRLRGYAKTRRLSLMPAVERILNLFSALKYFFVREKVSNCNFEVCRKSSRRNMTPFKHNICNVFNSTVLRIGAQVVTTMEVTSTLFDLISKCEEISAKSFLLNGIYIKQFATDEEISAWNSRKSSVHILPFQESRFTSRAN